MIWIGIDPGASGGIAVINSATNPKLKVYNMPASDGDIYLTLRLIQKLGYCSAALEKIQPSIYGIDKGDNAKLYGSFRALKMALTILGIPFDAVAPKDWQRALGIVPRKKKEKDSSWKGRLKEKAQQLYPRMGITLATADAVLLAVYCQRVFENYENY